MKGIIPFTDSPDFTCWEPSEIRGFDRAGICLDQGDKSIRGFGNHMNNQITAAVQEKQNSADQLLYGVLLLNTTSLTAYHLERHILKKEEKRFLTLTELCYQPEN